MLIALLAFYDEEPAFLDAYVAGIALAGARKLVAVDGAYALYPGGRAVSPPDQRQALRDACARHDVALSLHTPLSTWDTGEVGKRSRLMRLADLVSKRGDWHLVLDGDEHIATVPDDLAGWLASYTGDVAEIHLVRQIHADRPSDEDHHSMHRRLFRARVGLHVQSNHSTYVTADGRVLWCAGDPDLEEPCASLPDLIVTHMTRHRPEPRHHARGVYYTRRYELNVEPPWSPPA